MFLSPVPPAEGRVLQTQQDDSGTISILDVHALCLTRHFTSQITPSQLNDALSVFFFLSRSTVQIIVFHINQEHEIMTRKDISYGNIGKL